MFGYRYVSHRAPSSFDLPGPYALGEHFYKLTGSPAAEPNIRYLCVCKLDDIWQLHREGYEKRSNARAMPYLLDLIALEIGKDLSNGRCFVLLDLSGEGHPFVREAFDDLHSWCQSVGLQLNSVGLVSQNRALSVVYHENYSGGSQSIHFYNYDWIINALAGMLGADEDEFVRQFDFSKSSTVEFTQEALSQPFLCINATPRPVRLATLAALSAVGLLSRTRWSLLNRAAGKGVFNNDQVRSFLKLIRREDDLYPIAIDLLNGPDKRLDDVIVSDANRLVWSMPYASYRQTIVPIVTETDFTAGQIERVTEKTIKAFAMARPSIVIGNPNSLRLIRSFGFQTFDPLINETYDQINNEAARFGMLCDEIIRVNDILKLSPDSWTGACWEVASYNSAHARSGRFLQRYKLAVELPFWRDLSYQLHREPRACTLAP